MDELAGYILKLHEKMKGERSNWDSHWQETLDLVIPRKNTVFDYNTRSTGEKRHQRVYDSTAIIANQLLASALQGMLTNPASVWFDLKHPDPEIDSIPRVRKWLQKAVRKMTTIMNHSNFNTQIYEGYLDLGAIGTTVIRTEEDDELHVRYKARPIYEHYCKEDYRGIINCLSTEIKYSVREIHRRWNLDKIAKHQDAMTAAFLLELKNDPDKEFIVVRMVAPRKDFEYFKEHSLRMKINKRFEYASFYTLKDLCVTLEEKGFEEFPYAVPRFSKTSNETYGRGPGMEGLADIKMINEMAKLHIKAGQKAVDPAMQMPDDGVMLPIKLTPGGINYYRAGTTDRIEPITTNSRIDISFEMMEDVRNRIREIFYIDQLQLNEGPQMTATEVLQRTEEKLRLMGPVLGRLNFELLKPIISRTFNILYRKKLLPGDIPPELRGSNLQVQFSSSIARAQKASEADNLTRVLGIVGPIIQADPTVMDNIDGDAYLKFVANTFNVPQDIFRDEKDVEDIRTNRQQERAQAVQAELELKRAQAMNQVGAQVQQPQ